MATAAVPATKHQVVFHQLPIDQLVPWPKNPRKRRDKIQDDELAANIRSHGRVLEPLLVRPTLKGETFEVIAGERRLRAAKAAEIFRVPAIVQDLDDDQALHVALSENGHRNNLHPIDEAAAFAELRRLNPGVNTIDHLAAQHGRSVRYIKESLALLRLDPKVKKAFDEGDITVSHARMIARLNADIHAKALEACFAEEFDFDGTGKSKMMLATVRRLHNWINDNVRLDLASTEAQEDFPELVEDVNKAHAAGATVLMLSEAYGRPSGPKDPLSRERWTEAKSTDKHAMRGVIVEGKRRGRMVHVKLVDKTPAPGATTATRTRTRAGSKSGGAVDRSAERKQQAIQFPKLVIAVFEALLGKVTGIGKRELPHLIGVLGFNSELLGTIGRTETRDIEAAFKKRFGFELANADAVCQDPKKLPTQDTSLAKLAMALVLFDKIDGFHKSLDRAKPLLSAYGLDLKRLDKRVTAEAKAATKAAPRLIKKPKKT